MQRLVSLWLAALAWISPALAQEVTPYWEQQRCRPAIEQAVANLGLAPHDVLFITVKEKVVGPFNRRRLIGFDGWVRPVEDNGYLVIQVGLACGVQQVYTTGGYYLEGVSRR